MITVLSDSSVRNRPAEPGDADPADTREPYTRADLDWAAHAFNADPEPTDAEWDAMAAEAEALDRLCMGLCL
jgi:hypothetical protein